MTIEEKAKEYVDTCIDDDPINPFAAISRVEGKSAFKRGAEWMLEKACEYLKNQLPIQYSEYEALADENVRQFKKAMEE